MINITQTYAKIGIERNPSQLEIQTQNAKLEFKQKHAKINIHTELPRVEIDQYECFASAGLKNNLDLTREAVSRGQQQAMEYIGKVASDGARFAAIERGGNPIAEMAVRDAYPTHEFGLDFIPKARPKIEVKGSVKFDPERNSEGINNGVDGEYKPGSISMDYAPAKINIYLQQKASINISYQGTSIDSKI